MRTPSIRISKWCTVMHMGRQIQVTKNIYIGGDQGIRRLENLQRLADTHYRGNFSEMLNDALNKIYNLDPATGDPLPESLRKYHLVDAKNPCAAPPVLPKRKR